MLHKSKRLNLTKSFKWVTAGSRQETLALKLFFKEGENVEPLVGIALAKKEFRQANKRNRARRLSSTAIEQLYPQLRNNLNLVIMPKASVLTTPVDQIISQLQDVKALYRDN